MSDSHTDYINGFVRLILDGRQDHVRDALLARLDGRSGEVAGLVSPPLTRVEPDRVALLFVVYGQLAETGNAAGIEHFRRVLVEQFAEALADFSVSVARLTDFGRLIAYCRVADTRSLAGQLQMLLWGFLTTRLPRPFAEILDLEPGIRDRARIAFDLWLAASHPNLNPSDFPNGMPKPHIALIRQALNNVIAKFNGPVPPWRQRNLLLLLYRGMMKVAPAEAGRVYFAKMCKLAAGADPEVKSFRGRWNAVCWEYGRVFATERDWADAFFGGLNAWIKDNARYGAGDELRDALTAMGEPARPMLAKLPARDAADPEQFPGPRPEPDERKGIMQRRSTKLRLVG